MTHDEVTTLFHEFGHTLHHILTAQTEPQVSGINGVEWDAVELPSQFLENFAWEHEIVKSISAHVETGEQLPDELFDKMIAAKTMRPVHFACVRLNSRSLTCCSTRPSIRRRIPCRHF